MRFLLFWILLATTTAQAEPRLLPVDETAKDKSFAAFKRELSVAVKARDPAFIRRILSPDALASFGEDRGTEGFVRTYKFDDPQAPLWRELGKALALGGAFTRRGEFMAPYVAARWPEKYDPIDYVALVAKDAAVRAAPAADAEVLTRLSYSILKLAPTADEAPGQSWVKVELPGGRSGYVAAESIRSCIDYRAQFRRQGGSWMLISFVAGD